MLEVINSFLVSFATCLRCTQTKCHKQYGFGQFKLYGIDNLPAQSPVWFLEETARASNESYTPLKLRYLFFVIRQ